MDDRERAAAMLRKLVEVTLQPRTKGVQPWVPVKVVVESVTREKDDV